MLEGPASERSLVPNGAVSWGDCPTSRGFIDQFLAHGPLDRNCLWARFYDLNIDPKLLMHLLPLS